MKNKELIERIDAMINSSYWGATTELFKDCKQTIIDQQKEIERLNDRMDRMCKEYQSIVDEKVDEIERLKSDDFQLQRLWDWMQEENREPAQTKFTAGLLRNIAREIEFLKNKQEEREKGKSIDVFISLYPDGTFGVSEIAEGEYVVEKQTIYFKPTNKR